MLYQTLLSGIVVGCLYGLAGLGLVVVYKTTRVLSFAHGDITTLTMYVAATLIATVALPFAVVFPVILILGGILAALLERFLIRRLYKRPHLDAVMATLGVALILNGIVVMVWGHDPRKLPLPVEGVLMHLGPVQVNWTDALTIATSAVVILAVYGLFHHTRLGLAMRATFQNPGAARLMGIRSERVLTLAWGLSGALAAAAGLLITPITFLDPFTITAFVTYSFAALVLGGFESPLGAVVGGIILGVLSNLIGFYVSTEFKASTIFVVMLLVLIVRPAGLFGATGVRKA